MILVACRMAQNVRWRAGMSSSTRFIKTPRLR
jgi:hypothetical protein